MGNPSASVYVCVATQDASTRDQKSLSKRCCCAMPGVAAATSFLQASNFLTEAGEVCTALWHVYAFCCRLHAREKHRSPLPIITLSCLVPLTLILYAALSANAAFALRTACVGIPISTHVNQQRLPFQVNNARFRAGIRSVTTTAICAATPGENARCAAAYNDAKRENWEIGTFAALRVRIFSSSAADMFAAPPHPSRFTAINNICTRLACISLPRLKCRQSELAALATNSLLSAHSNLGDVSVSSAFAADLTRITSSRRAVAATAAVVALPDGQPSADTCTCAKCAAALLYAYAQRKRRIAAALIRENTSIAAESSSTVASARAASIAHATFAAAACVAGTRSLSSYAHGGAAASHCNKAHLLASIPSLRLQAPVLELQLPRLLLRLPLRAISIHLRYKLCSPESNRRSSSSDSDTYASSRNSSVQTRGRHSDSSGSHRTPLKSDRIELHNSGYSITSRDSREWDSSIINGDMRTSAQSHVGSEEKDSNRNNVQKSYSALDSCMRKPKEVDSETEAYLGIDALSSGAESTVDTNSRSHSVDSSETGSSTAEEQEHGKGGRLWQQHKPEDETPAAPERETGNRKDAGEWTAETHWSRVYPKDLTGINTVPPAAAAAVHDLDKVAELPATMQQDDALTDKHRGRQQQQGVRASEVFQGQHQGITALRGSHPTDTANENEVHSSFVDSNCVRLAWESAAPLLPGADLAVSAAAEPAAVAAAQAAQGEVLFSTPRVTGMEVKITKPEGVPASAAFTETYARKIAGAEGSPVAGSPAISRRIHGMAYEPRSTAAAKVGERILVAISVLRELIHAWTSPSVGIDIHPASNTFCFVAEAFPLSPVAASSWYMKELFHFLFPESAAALLRLCLFPDGFCLISSAVISPAAIISQLLLLFSSSSRNREEHREQPKKRLLLQGGLQHRWIEKLMQLLQVQLVVGCNLLHAAVAPQNAFFTLLLLGRPPCCPRAMRRCYRKAVYRQQRRLWRQQQEQLWKEQQQEEPWQQLQGAWDMQKRKLDVNDKISMHADSSSWRGRWFRSRSRMWNMKSNNASFRRDLAFQVLRSGAVENEKYGSPVASGSETFVTKISFVAAGSGGTCRDVDNRNRGSFEGAAIDLETEDGKEERKQGKHSPGAYHRNRYSRSSSNHMKEPHLYVKQTFPLATEERSNTVLQNASRWLRLLGMPARRGRGRSRSSSVTDPVLIDYREAAAAAREAMPTLHFSSGYLDKLLGEAQLFCTAVARGTLQWSDSDAGAAVDLQQVLVTANRQRRRLLQRPQTPHASGIQQQLTGSRRRTVQHEHQQAVQEKQRLEKGEPRLVPDESAFQSKYEEGKTSRTCESGAVSINDASEPDALVCQKRASLEQQQQIELLPDHLQNQAQEEENSSPWSVLLRAGDARVDVDRLILRLELIPASKTRAEGP